MIVVATPKNTRSDTASTIVVMHGLDITAGSNPHFLAKIGNVQPITFAKIISINSVIQTARSTRIVISSLWNAK